MEYIKWKGKNKELKKCADEKYVKASVSIEMSYIMPLFLFLFLLIIHTTFYYHDKAILNGAAAETAVLGAQLERRKETVDYNLEQIFRERTAGRLIYMTDVNASIEKQEEEIIVSATVRKSGMELKICQRAVITKPEEKIRCLN